MQVVRYETAYKSDWDSLVSTSGNGTFLLLRDYMEYHSARFSDASLLFVSNAHVEGILPANVVNDTVYSHAGLTYGGIITRRATYAKVQEMLDLAANYYRTEYHATKWVYKPIPYIYQRYPANEDLYWLFHRSAKLTSCALSSTVNLREPLPFSVLRKRHASKAERRDIKIQETDVAEDWEAFWKLLTSVLQERHKCNPVHSLPEIMSLKQNFPENIRLFVAKAHATILGGCVVYLTDAVVHIQYISANDEGCECGALDLLFKTILNSDLCHQRAYLDFGISTENGGRVLNEGLLFQKEGFGGRGVCYEQYEINLL